MSLIPLIIPLKKSIIPFRNFSGLLIISRMKRRNPPIKTFFTKSQIISKIPLTGANTLSLIPLNICPPRDSIFSSLPFFFFLSAVIVAFSATFSSNSACIDIVLRISVRFLSIFFRAGDTTLLRNPLISARSALFLFPSFSLSSTSSDISS